MFTSEFFLSLLITAVPAYLLGSVNFALVVSKLYANDDIRRHGSGNAGMTNILRTYGKLPAFYTALGDFFKGVAAVFFGRYIFNLFGFNAFDGAYIGGIFVLLGHLFPVYFKFKGGKGVLTSFGALLVINPIAFCIIAAICIPLVFIVKIVSLVSIIGAFLFPVLTYAMLALKGRPAIIDTGFAALFCLIIVFMHRQNIKRLLNGTEHKFGQPKNK